MMEGAVEWDNGPVSWPINDRLLVFRDPCRSSAQADLVLRSVAVQLFAYRFSHSATTNAEILPEPANTHG